MIQQEIKELFDECTKTSNIEIYNEDGKLNYQMLSPHQIGSGPAQSIAWKMFRCRADENKSVRFKRFTKACKMLSSGLYSLREVNRETGYSINTICTLFYKISAKREREGLTEIKCKCGLPIIKHRGWCKYRFKKSEKRKNTLAIMHRNRENRIPLMSFSR